MHSVHHSRARILFEVFCALAISASCVGAWMQTGASALLPAALFAALYGLVHAFDMAGRKAPVAVAPQRIDYAADDQGDRLALADAGPPPAAADLPLETDRIAEPELVPAPIEPELVEPAPAREKPAPRAKATRKSRARRASSPKEAVAELAPVEQAKASELPRTAEEEAVIPVHSNIEPLFAPEPFARQQRAVFGRKAR